MQKDDHHDHDDDYAKKIRMISTMIILKNKVATNQEIYNLIK
jgi:hypothetical protein